MTVLALLGAKALLLTYAWLLSAIVASYLSHRKGYGDRPGLASGLLLNAVGVVIWLLVPARADSLWKQAGPFGSRLRDDGPSRGVAKQSTTADGGETPEPGADGGGPGP